MAARSRVLMLVPYLPSPPESGGRRRTYELLSRLHREVDVTLLCLVRPQERAADRSALRDLGELHLIARPESPGLLAAGRKTLSSPRPVTVQIYRSAEMRELASILAERASFDAVHVESFYMLQNVPPELEDRVVLVEPDIESRAWGRYARLARPLVARPLVALEALKMRRAERRAWRAARLVGAVSREDLRQITARAPEVETFLVPNGVDVERFRPREAPCESRVALFLGDYKYFPNVDATEFLVEQVLPRLARGAPDLRLQLAGKDPPGRVRALARRPAVEVLGRVDDVREPLSRASVFVCPVRAGSGTRIKILEAMACGVPVVSTTVGCEGLELEPGRHLLVADGADAFASSVLALLGDRALAERLGESGRRWVERNASWTVGAGALVAAYHRAGGPASRIGTRRRQS